MLLIQLHVHHEVVDVACPRARRIGFVGAYLFAGSSGVACGGRKLAVVILQPVNIVCQVADPVHPVVFIRHLQVAEAVALEHVGDVGKCAGGYIGPEIARDVAVLDHLIAVHDAGHIDADLLAIVQAVGVDDQLGVHIQIDVALRAVHRVVVDLRVALEEQARRGAADADGAAVGRGVPGDGRGDIGNARPDVNRRAVDRAVAAVDAAAGVGHRAAVRVDRAALTAFSAVSGEGAAAHGHRAAFRVDRAAVALSGLVALGCAAERASLDRHGSAVGIDRAAVGIGLVALQLALFHGDRAAGGVDRTAVFSRIRVQRAVCVHDGHAAALHVQSAAVAGGRVAFEGRRRALGRRIGPGAADHRIGVQRVDRAAVVRGGIPGETRPVEVQRGAAGVDRAAVRGGVGRALRVAAEGAGDGHGAADGIEAAAVFICGVATERAAHRQGAVHAVDAAAAGRAVAADDAFIIHRAAGLVDRAAVAGRAVVGQAAARLHGQGAVAHVGRAAVDRRGVLIHAAADRQRAADLIDRAAVVGPVSSHGPGHVDRALVDVHRAAAGGRVAIAFSGAADGAADVDCTVIDMHRAAGRGGVADELSVSAHRKRARLDIHRAAAVCDRIVGQGAVHGHGAAGLIDRAAIDALGILQRRALIDSQRRVFRPVEHQGVPGLNAIALQGDGVEGQRSVVIEQVAVGIAQAAADDRRARALVLGCRRGDGDRAVRRNGHGVVLRANGILPDQHLDRGGLAVLIGVFHRVPEAVELLRADLADVLGQVEQHQLGVFGNLHKIPVRPVQPLGVIPVVLDLRDIRPAGNRVPRFGVQGGMIIGIVFIRGQHILDPAVHVIGKVAVDGAGKVFARRDAHGALTAFQLCRVRLGLALRSPCFHWQTDPAVGKGNFMIGIHMLYGAK